MDSLIKTQRFLIKFLPPSLTVLCSQSHHLKYKNSYSIINISDIQDTLRNIENDTRA